MFRTARYSFMGTRGLRPRGVTVYFRTNRVGTLSHMPLTVRAIEIVTACAGALGAFLSTHAAYFQADDPAPICGSCRRATGHEVRFTVPYNASLDKSANPKVDT